MGRRGAASARSPGAWLLAASLSLHGCAAPAPPGSAAPERHEVEMRGFAFLPADLEVAAGDTVVWLNRDVVVHNATGAGDAWSTGPIEPGESAAHSFPTPGRYDLLCTLHPAMTGTVTVR